MRGLGRRSIWDFEHGDGQLRHSTAYPRASTGSEEGDSSSSTRVFVGGLPRCIRTYELWESFEEAFGKVVDAVVICGTDERGNQQSRGFGFVRFEQQEDADEAVKRHYVTFDGRKVEVKRAVARMNDSPFGASTLNCSGLSSQIAAPLSTQARTSYLPGIRLPHDVRMQQPTLPDYGRSPPIMGVQCSHDLFTPSHSPSIAYRLAYSPQPPASRLNAPRNYGEGIHQGIPALNRIQESARRNIRDAPNTPYNWGPSLFAPHSGVSSALLLPADGFREITPSPTKHTEVGQASHSGYHRPVGSNAISGNHISNSLGVVDWGNPPPNVMSMFPPGFSKPQRGTAGHSRARSNIATMPGTTV